MSLNNVLLAAMLAFSAAASAALDDVDFRCGGLAPITSACGGGPYAASGATVSFIGMSGYVGSVTVSVISAERTYTYHCDAVTSMEGLAGKHCTSTGSPPTVGETFSVACLANGLDAIPIPTPPIGEWSCSVVSR